MKDGFIKIGNYNIFPNTNADILVREDFNVVKLEKDLMYISKEPKEINEVKFGVTFLCKDNIIKKIELCNALEKYKMNYENMKDKLVQELKSAHDDFLINNLGQPDKKSISSIEYDYLWGNIISYHDEKSSESGIVIVYF